MRSFHGAKALKGDIIMSFEEYPNNEQPDLTPEDAGAQPQAPSGGDSPENPVFTRPVQPIVPDEPGRGWSEPVYEQYAPSNQDAYTPGRYAYGAQNVPSPEDMGGKKKKKNKERRSHGFLKAVALVVVCALVAGLSSWLVVDYMMDNRVTGGNKQVVFGSPSVSDDDVPQPAATPGQELTGNQIYSLAEKQVVGVQTSLRTTNIFGQTSTSAVSGSGFIISEDGYILTNYHVISYAVVYGGTLTVLTKDGAKYDAQIVGYLESNDVAVIKIDATGLTPVTIGNSDNILVGEWVYAVGNPLGELDYTMTPGIVSAQDRVITTADEISGENVSVNMFQISAAVNHGNSGGPVYNSRGEVIGMVAAKYADADEGIEGLGFAIPINDAISIARQVVETGRVMGAGMGVQVTDVSQVYNEYAISRYNIPEGCHVDSVNDGSAAQAAGILEGDIITALDGKSCSSVDEMKLLLRRYSPGDTATVTVYRMTKINTGESLDLTITFEEMTIDQSSSTQQQQQQQQTNPTFPWGDGWPW